MSKNMSRFKNLNYDSFKELAQNSKLSKFEKIGFPDSYRLNLEPLIYRDICFKLPSLLRLEGVVVDIGCGCSELPELLAKSALELNQNLMLVDSKEMLDQLQIEPNDKVVKYPAQFPNCPELISEFRGKVNSVLVYSVIQYVFSEGNLFDFIDNALLLLASGGRMLIGDIPNISMRKRFFASDRGIVHHQEFTKSKAGPSVIFNTIELNQIDDSVMIAIVTRARLAGFHAFILPQSDDLPMANRREDILIIRP